MSKMFRALRADEIDVRVSQIGDGWIQLLLYKDARCDQAILDETVGEMNWQNEYSRDNKNCKVSIYDEKKQMWISKENTGVQSMSEKEKGLASDSFKRACFNWGIGRELYTKIPIFIRTQTKQDGVGPNGKPKYKEVKKMNPYVSQIIIDKERDKITKIEISDAKENCVIFRWVEKK